jgi:hypothetical protein
MLERAAGQLRTKQLPITGMRNGGSSGPERFVVLISPSSNGNHSNPIETASEPIKDAKNGVAHRRLKRRRQSQPTETAVVLHNGGNWDIEMNRVGALRWGRRSRGGPQEIRLRETSSRAGRPLLAKAHHCETHFGISVLDGWRKRGVRY